MAEFGPVVEFAPSAGPLLAASGLGFLLPRGMGLLELIAVTQLVWLGVMGIFGIVLRRLVHSPRDSVVVFYRIFWRMFLRPNAVPIFDAYDAPPAMSAFDDHDVAVLDHVDPVDLGGGALGGGYVPEPPPRGRADASAATANPGGTLAGGTLSGTMMGTMSGTMSGSIIEEAIPPEPAPVGVGETAIEAELVVNVVPHAGQNRLAGFDGEALTLEVTCGGEDGLANRHLLIALRRSLGIDPHQMTLLRGHMKPQKLVRVSGLSPEQVQLRLMNR